MWLWLTLLSALLLGTYDVAKKRALKRNGVYWILVTATGLTALYLSPFLFLAFGGGLGLGMLFRTFWKKDDNVSPINYFFKIGFSVLVLLSFLVSFFVRLYQIL